MHAYLYLVGCLQYDGNTVTNYTPFGANWVNDLTIDTNNNVFTGVRGKGLYKFDGVSWNQLTPMPDTGVSIVTYCDRFNRIWYSEQFTGLWVSDIGNGITEKKGINFSAFPTPTNSELNISLELKQVGDLTLDLYNSFGQLVNEKTFTHRSGTVKEKIDLRNFSKGIYSLSIRTSSTVESKLIILN